MKIEKKTKKLLEKKSPSFIDAIATAKAYSNSVVLTDIIAFQNDPELLYAALLYATSEGISVTFVVPGYRNIFPNRVD